MRITKPYIALLAINQVHIFFLRLKEDETAPCFFSVFSIKPDLMVYLRFIIQIDLIVTLELKLAVSEN